MLYDVTSSYMEGRCCPLAQFGYNRDGKKGKLQIVYGLQRRRIYVKAKADTSWRFWGLYVHVCKLDTLREAYALAKKNDGAPGSDGMTFVAIEAQGVEVFLEQIADELVGRTYVPLPARKQEIPKDGGKVRVLSIPAIRDRVVQCALKLILEPIFEADFQPGSFGYRPQRTTHEAVARVARAIVQHKTRVIDIDLSSYFDNVRHDRLLAKVAERVDDGDMNRPVSTCPVLQPLAGAVRAFIGLLRPLRPLLTSAPRSGRLTTPSVLWKSHRTRCRSPGVSPASFIIAHPPDLQFWPLMDMDFATSCPLVRPAPPHIGYLFVRSRLCSTLPSDGPSRFRPCASLVLHLHQVAQGTCTPKTPGMPGTPGALRASPLASFAP